MNKPLFKIGEEVIYISKYYPEYSNCLFESTEPLKPSFDIDAEMAVFKREINRQLSTGDIL